MLCSLTLTFALSFTFRTLPAIMAAPVKAEFGVSDQELGLFAAAFSLSFAACQLPLGIALDRFGPRRTLVATFLSAVVGSAVSAAAPNFPVLVLGQLLIGAGCSPALIATLLFVDRRYPKQLFGSVSGWVMSLGGLGMLATGTPLAWVVEHGSWRMAFAVSAAVSALVWIAVWSLVDDGSSAVTVQRQPPSGVLRDMGRLLADRRNLGILCLAAVTYPAFMTLRGLWIVPLLGTRHGFTLVESGNVVFMASLVALFGPALFGRGNPGYARRRQRIVLCTLAFALVYAGLAFSRSAAIDIGLAIFSSFFSGYIVLQYADVRAAFPPEAAGRALAVFTTAMFLGVAAMQLLTGFAASTASEHAADPLAAVLLTIAGLLVFGASGYAWLPRRAEHVEEVIQ